MMIESIGNSGFFHGFQTQELKNILLLCTQDTFRKGKILFYQGDKSEGAFYLAEGTVNKIKYRSDDTSVMLGKAGPGSWLGLAETICRSICLYDASVSESSTVLYFSTRNFQIAMKNHLFTRKILETLSKEHFLLHNQLELNQPSVRIIQSLLNAVSGKPSGNLVVHTTQDELAELNGVTRETVNKHLNRLQQDGLILIGRGKIEILLEEELERLI